MMRRIERVLAIGILLALGVAYACTPAQREVARTVGPALARAACVILRATTSDGTTDTICATADELAPLVTTLLAERAEHPVATAPTREGDASTSSLNLSVALEPIAELPAPKKPVPRRRCIAWRAVNSSEAGAHDAAAE